MAEYKEMIKVFKELGSQELNDGRKNDAQDADLVNAATGSSITQTVEPDLIAGELNASVNEGQHTICSNCRNANPVDSSFCMACGGRLGFVCGHCKANLPAGAKFCNYCGHRVSAQARHDVIATLMRGESVNLQTMIDDFEKLLIDTALGVAKGNMSQAAELLQIHRTTLYSRIQSKLQK